MWANFKIFFAKVFKDARDDGLTAQTSGYAANVRQLQEDEVTTGFSKVRTLSILTHLWTTYGSLKE